VNCPRCAAPLDAFELSGGPEIDICSYCGGAWYDRGELDIPGLGKGGKPGGADCPRCSVKLLIARYGKDGPEIDRCGRCGGVWIDQGELQQIRKISGRARMTTDSEGPLGGETPAASASVPGQRSPSGAVGAAAIGAAMAPLKGKGGAPESPAPGRAGSDHIVVDGQKITVRESPKNALVRDVRPKGRAAHKPPPYGPWTEYWDEFLLYSPEQGYAWLIRENDHFNLVRTTKLRPAPDPFGCLQKARVRAGGVSYKVYDFGTAVLDEAEGETPWVAIPGDKVKSVDCIDPPRIFTVERSGREIEFFSGEYLKPEEVWSGFGLKGAPPEPKTIDACQPFYESPTAAQCKWWALAFASVFFALFSAVFLSGDGRLIHQEMFSSPLPSMTHETGAFRIEKAGSICRLKAAAGLDNQWIWLGFDVLDEGGKAVGEFSKQLSFYHGRDAEGSWTEGSRSGGALFKIADTGTYRLRVTAQAGSHDAPDSIQLPVELAVYDGYEPRRYYLVSLIIAGLAALLLFSRRSLFESRRWGQVIEDDDDD